MTPGSTGVTISTGDIESYGKQISDGTLYVDAAQAKLAEARGGGGDFTSFPAAQAVFAQHQGVLDVFESTLGLVRTDVETFGANIVQAARSYQQTDDNALSCLQSIASGITPTALDKGFEQVRSQHNDTLSDVTLTDEETADFQSRESQGVQTGLDTGGDTGTAAPASPNAV